jgi:hypothetical protein
MSQETDRELKDANAELERLAQEQGVKPLDLDRILAEEPLGPADETADMMIEEIYRWRREGRDRSLP